MGRRPTITRGAVAAAAIDIIDRDGIDGFSLERVATALNVRAPSLYNHFTDRSAILTEVARAVVLETPRVPDPEQGQWRQWLIAECREFRNTLLRHPNIVPIVFTYFPDTLLNKLYTQHSRLLADHGVPSSHCLFLLEATHRMTVGSAMCTATGRPAPEKALPHGLLVSPQAADADEMLFTEMLRAFLDGVVFHDR